MHVMRLISISTAISGMLEIKHGTPADNVSLEFWRFLRQIFPPLPGMRGSVIGAPAIRFGPRIEGILDAKCVDTVGRLTLLRARLHSETVEEFSYHTNLVFGWTALEAAVVWNDIQLTVTF